MVIEVWANGVAENAVGRTVSFEAHAPDYAESNRCEKASRYLWYDSWPDHW